MGGAGRGGAGGMTRGVSGGGFRAGWVRRGSRRVACADGRAGPRRGRRNRQVHGPLRPGLRAPSSEEPHGGRSGGGGDRRASVRSRGLPWAADRQVHGPLGLLPARGSGPGGEPNRGRSTIARSTASTASSDPHGPRSGPGPGLPRNPGPPGHRAPGHRPARSTRPTRSTRPAGPRPASPGPRRPRPPPQPPNRTYPLRLAIAKSTASWGRAAEPVRRGAT